ncbi:hypothetical protein TNCV_334981 [Trichonephila clavipes]|nr:hypothetical protein TNCV_334981 [Trichonephila clavipes]
MFGSQELLIPFYHGFLVFSLVMAALRLPQTVVGSGVVRLAWQVWKSSALRSTQSVSTPLSAMMIGLRAIANAACGSISFISERTSSATVFSAGFVLLI